MEKEKDLKQDENHETEKLEQEILVEIEALRHLLFLFALFHALFSLPVAEIKKHQQLQGISDFPWHDI